MIWRLPFTASGRIHNSSVIAVSDVPLPKLNAAASGTLT
jgi:hypothetical protein